MMLVNRKLTTRTRVGFNVNFDEGEKRDTAIQLLFGFFTDRVHVIRAGWGFDTDLPLRPWPQYQRHTTPVGGTSFTIRCAIWCGFYVAFDVEDLGELEAGDASE